MKIIKIKRCWECPHRDKRAMCMKKEYKEIERKIEEAGDLPKWCPLEDYKARTKKEAEDDCKTDRPRKC